MTIRVLIVDDHEPWRQLVIAELLREPHCEIVGEVSDGLEAVEAAARLTPDLILMDVGLPSLSGIEAARRIRATVPGSRILFLSANLSPAVVDAALATGAGGYVLKLDAGQELLPAVETIMQGREFVSARLRTARSVTKSPRTAHSPASHELALCSDELAKVNALARFAETALKAGSAVIVAASSSNRLTIHRTLQAWGLGVDLAIERGMYVPLDVADTLSTVMVNGALDDRRFREFASALIAAAGQRSNGTASRVAACGECAATLWKDGNAAAAIRLEQLWDELARTHNVDVLCGYSLELPIGDDEKRSLEDICAVHSAVHPC